MKNKNIIRIVLVTVVILLIPFTAMQFTSDVMWSPFDFIFAAVLLLGTGLTYEFVSNKSNNMTYRVAVGVAVMTGLLLIWIIAAVGIIGDGDLDNAANVMYFGVLVVGIIGAAIARFTPRGMSRALFATAFAQALVPVIALVIQNPSVTTWGPPGVAGVFVLNTIFVLLFVGSALLFRRASIA